MEAHITQGIQAFCEEYEVYWFVDIILSYQTEQFQDDNDFQVWNFIKDQEGDGCRVVCEDGNENKLIEQGIELTNCELPLFTFWFANGVVYLPSEH